MTNQKLRYGLIGAGNNAVKKHVSNYTSLSNIEFVSVCDINIENASKVASAYNVQNVYSDFREMLKCEKLDIVSICTPNHLHADIAVYALQQGVNVHCEKPLAINAAEAQRIVDAKNDSGKKVMVGLNNRFTNEAVKIKQYIDEGFFGEIYHAKTGWRRRSGIPGRGTWFTNKDFSGGGVMIDLGVHFLDLTLFLLGLPEPSYIAGSTYQNFANSTTRNRNGYKGNLAGIFNVEDTAVGWIGLKSGATLHFDFSWASNIESEETFVEILGTKGGAIYRNGELKFFSEHLDTCIDIIPQLNSNIKSKNEFEHFVNCIINDDILYAPAEDGVYMMNIVDHFYRAAKLQAPVLFESKSAVKI
ncbi:Gfo/Idh/MocA family oxidoreductase [Niallia sp. Man26]|uniref:Gfo/Idh/MocA family protein n=1 Tax=Niallia sp. Man26 TaxID=2912824 RepID=UPI001EDB85FA|nr:Gfo/Idh/MocA family oxidoreductase [Niallia sp. Man26]UPO91064.1 Gfo/Idh/MocA family oxidoreductase [Niallia sp. Man26]